MAGTYPTDWIVQQATWVGSCSPCAKSKRGVVIWDGAHGPLAWLLHDDGPQCYSAVEFHRRSLAQHELPSDPWSPIR